MSSLGFTPKIQHLMIYSLSNGGITFQHQDIFTSQKYYDAIRFLKANGLIIKICTICRIKLSDNNTTGLCYWKDKEHRSTDKKKKCYTLTLKGEILTRIIRGLH